MDYKKKTGILGGTFNPIHMGHLILAQTAMEEASLDEILFIPSGKSYMKDPETVLPAKRRVSMTGLAIEDNPYFALSMLEVEKEGDSYSYETVVSLQEANPGNKYYFIVGADSLLAMEQWKYPEKIFGTVTILAACREGSSRKELEEQISRLTMSYQADIKLISVSNIDISSSKIRENIRNGKSIRYLVPEKVADYIRRNQLYQSTKQAVEK